MRLRQVLSNLIENAIKYGDEHTIEVTLKGNGSRLLCKVSNLGGTLEPDALKGIFDPLRRQQERLQQQPRARALHRAPDRRRTWRRDHRTVGPRRNHFHGRATARFSAATPESGPASLARWCRRSIAALRLDEPAAQLIEQRRGAGALIRCRRLGRGQHSNDFRRRIGAPGAVEHRHGEDRLDLNFVG